MDRRRVRHRGADHTILDCAAPKHVHGVDPSTAFIDYARSRSSTVAHRFDVGDAQMLPEADGRFDVAVSGPRAEFRSQARSRGVGNDAVVRPHGIVAAYVWDYGGKWS
jgi:hypothetical protein